MIQVDLNKSIYQDMYVWGLKHIPIEEVEISCRIVGKPIRPKDYENYWNGWHNSTLYKGPGSRSIFELSRDSLCRKKEPSKATYFEMNYKDYPENPFLDLPPIQNRFVPCNKNNKPMIEWGKKGCMTLVDARAKFGQKYLAENLKGTQLIVIDIDGDHDGLDTELINYMWKYTWLTHTLKKPMIVDVGGKELRSPSYHLTFKTDRLIPTMHFPEAHIDIAGNAKNQLRYFKNKIWNQKEPVQMTPWIWEDIKEFIRGRKNGEELVGATAISDDAD